MKPLIILTFAFVQLLLNSLSYTRFKGAARMRHTGPSRAGPYLRQLDPCRWLRPGRVGN